MAADPRSATGDEKLDAAFGRIAGMPDFEQSPLLRELARETGIRLEALGTLFRLSEIVRREADEKFACLKLRTYLETHRLDIEGEDDCEGGLIVPCPLSTGERILVRDASLIGSRPIVERLSHGGYTPSIAEYAKALIGDDMGRAMACIIQEGEIEMLAMTLASPERAKALSVSDLRSINRAAMKQAGDATLDAVLELNERYAKVDQCGQIVIFDLVTFQAYLPKEFHAKLSGERVQTFDKEGKPKAPLLKSKLWMAHPAHLQYEGVGFYPDGLDGNGRIVDTDGLRILNLWRGFAVRPVSGDWSLLEAHLRNVICDGNEAHYQYVRKWLAHMFQRPWEKPGVAIVVKGLKRTGKGTMADMIRLALGNHLARMYTHQDHVIGRFAGESRPKLFKQIEEALYARNGSVEGPLKSKITDQTETVEQKFKMPVEVQSYTRYWFNSNEDAPVPATHDEERYLILNVSAERRNDHAYFDAIRTQMLNGGLEAMVHDLLQEGLSSFNVRSVPASKAKSEVVVEMLDPKMKAVFDIVVHGEIPAARSSDHPFDRQVLNEHEQTYVDKDHLYAVLELPFRGYGSRKASSTAIGRYLREKCLVSGDVRANRSLSKRAQFIVRPLAEIRRELAEQYNLELVDLGHQPEPLCQADELDQARAALAKFMQKLGDHPAIAEAMHLVEMAEAMGKSRRRADDVVHWAANS